MKILLSIYHLFMFPYNITASLYSYITIFKKYKRELRSDETNNHFAGLQLLIKINEKIGKNQEEIKSHLELLDAQIGVLKFVLPIVFWLLIINWIF